MANLQSVVKELQQQNNTLSDVKESIASMLSEDLKRRKEEERRKGDDEEARREKGKEKRKAQTRPDSFRKGLAQGSGISTITDLLKGFSGALGGGSLGGLLGLAAGKLFVPVLTGLLGAKYLSKWVKPITDRIFGEDATAEVFGQQIPVDKIGGAIAGVIGMLLAPALIKKALTATFGIGAATGRLILSRVIGKMGIAAAANAAGETVGDLVSEAADKDKMKKDVKKSSKFKRFGKLFKVVAFGLGRLTIPGAIITTAAAGVYFMAKYIQDKQDEMIKDLEENMEKKTGEIAGNIAAGKAYEAAMGMTAALAHMKMTGTQPSQDELSNMTSSIQDSDLKGTQRSNFEKMLLSLETSQPDVYNFTPEKATNYAKIRMDGQVASLEETIMKNIPGLASFSQMTRFQQEGIVGAVVRDLNLSPAGVNPAQIAADFLDSNFPKASQSIYSGRSKIDPRLQMLKDDPLAYANSYLKGHTGQTINIGTVDNSTNHGGGGQSGSGQSMLYQFNPTYDHNYNKIEYGIAGSGNATLGILGVR